jgi:peptidoglycan/LPS O-acetylase OafA/YrhL
MFFAGAALASAPPSALHWISRIRDWPVIAVVVLVNMLFAFGQNFNVFICSFALSSLLLVATVICGRGILNRLFCQTPLRRLGNISYSFYLLHGTVVIATVDYLGPVLRGLPASAQFGLLIALSFAASIGCSHVSFLLFEKMYFDRRKRTGPSEQAERVGAFRARSVTVAPEAVTNLKHEV